MTSHSSQLSIISVAARSDPKLAKGEPYYTSSILAEDEVSRPDISSAVLLTPSSSAGNSSYTILPVALTPTSGFTLALTGR